MKLACVTTNVLDLWAEPRYNSERKSQLLYGDIVTVGTRRGGFARVTEQDGYVGWVDERFLAPSLRRSSKAERGWQWARVSRPALNIPTRPHILFYGTRLLVKSAGNGDVQARLSGESVVELPASAFEAVPSKPEASSRRIINQLKRFLGSPYLWGGITVFGLDCSGLARAVYRQSGIYLPRDTKDQIKVGAEVDRSAIRPGDLLFFDRHVAIALGGGKIIHSSRSGGGVRIQSLVKEDPDYRADLDRDFKVARRLCASD